jgi:ankyrin repeat protein
MNSLKALQKKYAIRDYFWNPNVHTLSYYDDLKDVVFSKTNYQKQITRIKANLDNVNITNVNKADPMGRTLLHKAVIQNDFETMQLLIEFGATVDAFDQHKRTPIQYAAIFGYAEIFEYLFLKDANLHIKGQYGTTLAHEAAYAGSERILQIMEKYQYKFGLHDTDEDGLTPLHVAVIKGHLSCVICLLFAHPPYLETKDKYGQTPLFMSILLNKYDVAEALIHDFYANVCAKDFQEETILHIACILSNEEAVTFVLNHYSDHKRLLNEKNKQHMTALQLAFKDKQYHILDALFKAMRPQHQRKVISQF